MRKTVLLLASVALAVLLASGVAFAATFRGTDGDDRIVGTEKADQIFGLGGEDNLEGRGGGDKIYGGPGSDTGSGEEGNDTIYLGPGNDGLVPRPSPCGRYVLCVYVFEGGLGKDVMYGGPGRDDMTGDRYITRYASDFRGGADIMYGEGGNDAMDGGAGSNTLYGGNGNDHLGTTNHEHSEVWYGGAGDDYLGRFRPGYTPDAPGVSESDTFYGGGGDDQFVIEGNAKGDLFYGGAGNDDFEIHLSEVVGSGKHRIYCGSGRDTVTYDPSREDIVTYNCERVTRA